MTNQFNGYIPVQDLQGAAIQDPILEEFFTQSTSVSTDSDMEPTESMAQSVVIVVT